jgi:hypothetical protein
MHTYGDDFWCSGWGAGIGVDLNFDGITYSTYDARAHDGISFWARSDHNSAFTIYVRINAVATTSVEYGGTCEFEVEDSWTCNPRFEQVVLSSEWQFYEVEFPSADTDHSRLTNIQFLGTRYDPRSETPFCPFDFWIDDLRFY